ncbi:MAG: hypothetical protein KGL19_01315 [Bacteroidota bacterium]|nr:hypothetical protein [Bacteroidota bacterium]
MPTGIERLDELITITLYKDNLSATVLTDKQIREWIQKAAVEKENIRKELMHPPGGINTQTMMKLYVQRYQSALVYLLDKLFTYQNECKNPPLHKVYAAIIPMLHELLVLIEERFTPYFNEEEKMPDADLQTEKQSIANKLSLLKRSLSKTMDDDLLLSIVFTALAVFSNHSATVFITHHHFKYAQLLITEMHHLVSRKELIRLDIIRLLVYLNFNCTAFKNYLVEYMNAEIQTAKSRQEKAEKLLLQYRFMNQIQVMDGMALKPQSASVKEDIMEWIGNELQCMEKTNDSRMEAVKELKNKEEIQEAGIYYLLTVEEIALLKRIMKDSGYISNKNITVLMKDVSKMAHSVKQYEVSWLNLYNSFFNYNLTTIETLNEKLFVMLGTLRKLETKLKQDMKKK